MQTLPTIVSHVASLTQRIIENMGEITPDIEAELASVDIQVSEKVDSYKYVIDRRCCHCMLLRSFHLIKSLIHKCKLLMEIK